MKKTNRQERERVIREFINRPEFQEVAASWMLGHSDALQWAAGWIENSAKANGNPAIQDFAANMAMSIRAATIGSLKAKLPEVPEFAPSA